jgi:hypothetical protein
MKNRDIFVALAALFLTNHLHSLPLSSLEVASETQPLPLKEPKEKGQERLPLKESDLTPSSSSKEPSALSKKEVKETSTPPSYTVFPAGKTLPEKVIKATTFYAYTYGDKGYSPDGKSSHEGFTMQRGMSGILLNYGVTDRLSIGVGLPITVFNHITMNGTQFENSFLIKEYYDRMVRGIAEAIYDDPTQKSQLQMVGVLSDVSSVDAIINSINSSNMPVPSNVSIPLPTGENYTFSPGTMSLRDMVNTILTQANRPVEGLRGIGDLQVGFLWAAIRETSKNPISLSLGGGARFPTAQFKVPRGYKTTGGDATLMTGGGTYDAIFRLNVDFRMHPGLYLSFQNSTEHSLTKVELTRTSLINPGVYNTTTPSEWATTLDFEREGLRNVGFLQLGWGLATLSPLLKPVGLTASFKYNIAAQAYLQGIKHPYPDGGPEQYYSVLTGVTLSGLPYRIPLVFEFTYETPVAGSNRVISPSNIQANLSLFAKL